MRVRNTKAKHADAVELYIENCRKYELRVDPGVVIALQTG